MERRMQPLSSVAWALGILLAVSPATGGPRKEPAKALADYVNPLGGTDSTVAFSRGNLYPAVSVPFGMNAWTPQTSDNADGWTYQYAALRIRGLKLTHQPSPWINDYGAFSLMPVTGELKVREKERAALFSHAREEAHPYGYRVKLMDYGVWAEVTPTSRGAVLRFTFPRTDAAYVVLDAFPKQRPRGGAPASALGPVSVKVDPGRRRITGVSRYNSGGVPDNFGHHFVVEFDRDVLDSGVWNEKDGLKEGQELSGDHAGVWVRFHADAGAVVQARVATSFISPEQAQLNFDREVAGLGFDAVRQQAAREWEELLGRVRVEGGSEAAKEVFYSCLYRGSLFPRPFHEIDAAGRTVHYSLYNGRVEPGPLFTDNGFWDTFRAAFPLLTILHPGLDAQIMQGIVNAYGESGWIPEWQSPGHRDCMIGTNSSAILADAWIKGIRGWDAEKAWEGIVKGAHAESVPLSSVGRLGASYYNRLGYVPSDVGINESAARTLEYAFDDFCNWRLGRALGKPEGEIAEYAQRARNYRNLFDAKTGFMRGRRQDGSWPEPFRPDSWGGVFTEGSAWHWTWSVFHDPAGLAALFGGDERMAAKLDAVFTSPPTNEYSYYGTMIHEIAEMVVGDMGQYAHGNQPIQHMIYLYNWVGEPWKTQYWARQTMHRMYRPGPGMYCGDEDNGQTSAWYVMSAMGFYSVTPGQTQLALGSPLFDKVTLRLENGRTFNIEAAGNSPENVYVQAVRLNGRPLSRTWIDYAEIMAGGTLALDMGPEPDRSRGTRPEDRPYSMSLDPSAH
jgi:predicted alpha-1,2-mannosidase